jgi:LuxR family maltose regulon positive regulatory protein
MGQRDQARALLDALGVPHTALGAVAAARIHLLVGEVSAAERALPDCTEVDLRTRIGADLVGALTALHSGADEIALDRVEDALLAAAPVALRRPFLTDAADLRDLLQRRVERGSAAAGFAIDLLQRMSGGPTDELAVRRTLVDPLTDRELTVLRYLASTLSNAEIASELYVSVNTVKTHQRAVYRKLGAEGRRDAVRRARTLSLL